MSRDPGHYRRDRALIAALRDAGDFLLPETVIVDEIRLRVHPAPTVAEAQEAIRHAESKGRITGVTTETGRRYRLNDTGRAWALEEQL